MIHLIYGAKGSGKTKRIIDMANASIDTTTGDIVFITDTNRYMYDIKYQIRFINTEDNHIFTEEALLGFIKGLIAGNHDIKTIYIDGAHRIAKKDVDAMQAFPVSPLVSSRISTFSLTSFFLAGVGQQKRG